MSKSEKIALVAMLANLAVVAYYQERNYRLAAANAKLSRDTSEWQRGWAERQEQQRT